jgi:hypothetical protein
MPLGFILGIELSAKGRLASQSNAHAIVLPRLGIMQLITPTSGLLHGEGE